MLALLGWGAMSLAVGRLVASIVLRVLLIWWSPVPYRFGWDREVAGRLLRFGLPLPGSSIVVFAVGYADQLDRRLDARRSRPSASMSSPSTSRAGRCRSSRSRFEPSRRRRSRHSSRTRTHDAQLHPHPRCPVCVALPACLAISGAATPSSAFVYGAEWAPAADVLLWLAAFAALRIWFELAYDYLVVHGKSGVVLLIQAASFAVALSAMLLGAPVSTLRRGRSRSSSSLSSSSLPLYVLSLHRSGMRALAASRPSAIVPPLPRSRYGGVCLCSPGGSRAFFAAAARWRLSPSASSHCSRLWQRDELRLLRAALRDGRRA